MRAPDTQEALAAASPLALAEHAWSLVAGEPARASSLAARALAAARRARDPAAASVALRALGMASLEIADADTSVAHLRGAVRAGRRAGQVALEAEAEMALALALQHRGDAGLALRHADAAVALAPEQLRLALQRALMQERLGRLDAALAAYRAVERAANAAGDRETLARVLCNRGVLLTYRGDFAAAQRDLVAGEELCLALGLGLMTAAVRSNLGYLAMQRGELVRALQYLDEARPTMEAAGGLRHGIYELDRCEVLLHAGLIDDAVAAGRAATALLESAGMQAEAAEARLLTAQAELRRGDAAASAELAEAARRAFARQRRLPWQALAQEVLVRAQFEGGRHDAALLARARRAAEALREAGWPSAAASARVLSARVALQLGRTAIARRELQAAAVLRAVPVAARVQARHAQALLRIQDGDLRGAQAALQAGWRAVEDHRATLGATELRVGAAGHATELSALGARLAAAAGRPAQVLAWAERSRAGALFQPPAQAPQDPRLAEALDALRSAVAELDAAAKEGGDTRPLLRRQTAMEEEVRRRAQLTAAHTGGVRRAALAPAELHAALGDRALIELVAVDGALLAVVAAGGRLTLHELGSAQLAARESGAARMALRRLARQRTPAPLRAAARAAADHATAALASQLLAPLRGALDGRPVVIVPTGALHGTPWPALPGIAPELTVAPSAALWVRGHRSAAAVQPERVLLAAGPGLEHADREIASIAQLYAGATVRDAASASAREIRALLPGADVAHLACHGRFRADNPLFSALQLGNGELSVFELERLSRVPERFILSACESGLSQVRPGDELMGLTAALLRLGTRSLVASVLPVPDGASRRLMVELHRALAAGATASAALAQARTALDPSRDEDLVAGAAFLSFGGD